MYKVELLNGNVKFIKADRFELDGRRVFFVTEVELDDGRTVRIRRLTPRERFRLQGFPDEYFERAASVCTETQLYKQAGNSVTVNVIYEIAKRLNDAKGR